MNYMVNDMNLINQLRKRESIDQNLFNEFEAAWAEYEYICQMIKSKILDMMSADGSYWQEEGFKDNFYCDVTIDEHANILITVSPVVSTSVIQEISELLGVDGKIVIIGSKKHAKMRISFSSNVKVNYEEDMVVE